MKKENFTKSLKKVGKPLSIVIALLIIIGIVTYFFASGSIFAKTIQRIIPVPAAMINYTHWIGSKEMQGHVSAIRHKYESADFVQEGIRVDFTTQDGKKRLLIRQKDVLNKMIEDRIIEMLAKKEGVSISDSMVEDFLKRSTGTEENYKNLSRQVDKEYGWDIGQLSESIIKPRMYREELEEKFVEQNKPTKAMKSAIKKAQDELVDGRTFEDVARQHSEGRNAQEGGAWGWFYEDQLLEEIGQAVFSLEVGGVSEIIESPIGFHIVRLDELRDTEDGEPLARISQIIVRKASFTDWLTQEIKEYSVAVPLKEFYWDRDNARVEFKDATLRAYEAEVRANPQGDISVL